ncbi:DUF4293 domain-containing protein [Dysgonomonas sp. Marseille-P4361]|uniref:DUF4293 domain-containing protein n=1 Tax=Dysgonomonas sp. Marseille-P4361 TaxID=2161820 RepID=UPI000D55933E|nr:DUF4293 domain-containing protein [Dysgonomonas sp. Marseille-P4361]
MIQRIQTIFLLLTAIFMASAVFCPLFEIVEGGKLALTFHSFGIGKMFNAEYPTWGILTFGIISSLLAFINIFLFKKRKLQINIALITALSIVVYFIATLVYLNAYLSKLESDYNLNIQFGIILPVLALIFDLLAMTRIKKDEKLVKSLDRIR